MTQSSRTPSARTDIFSPEKRSAVMRAVKAANTKPEIRLRKALHARGLRYALHRRDLPGKPDIVFPKYKAVLFVHGCFWHGHDCKRGARLPKTNTDYWREKIARNKARDADHERALVDRGWRVLIAWECDLKTLDAIADELAALIRRRL
ncbi:MAG: very short patch repair endonuclease [Pseudomonadota bacterium]